jgi:SAM-dependent methyltransferase
MMLRCLPFLFVWGCSALLIPTNWAKAAFVAFTLSTGDLEGVFGEGWRAEPPSFVKGDFARLDDGDDAAFYATPRFVEHIDDRAVKALTKYNDDVLKGSSTALDLCGSWNSHVTKAHSVQFAGLGMNADELNRNQMLTERVVMDLNKRSGGQPVSLPWPDATFDNVLLQLSVDYLIQPIEVFKEIHRVLRPGGRVHVSFSNRVFIDKAVASWTGKSDMTHIEQVGDYLRLSGFSISPTALELAVSAKGLDPLYVVVGQKEQ